MLFSALLIKPLAGLVRLVLAAGLGARLLLSWMRCVRW